jgi:DNA (cytosine-5)-methyltransferase 1
VKPRLLDLFCGAGGCARGYQQAGFHVTGVDNRPQPRYAGDEFVQADALEYLRDHGREYDCIHASPPCELYSRTAKIGKRAHPDLVGPVRELLKATELPYVIENVEGAPLRDPQCLEGQMFDGLRVIRPRYFETNWPLDIPLMRLCRPRQTKMGRAPRDGEYMHVVGNFTDAAAGREAMGIDWMTRDELAQAIPPAYTEHIGGYLMAEIRARKAAA